jgi:hypothetical protein
VRFERYFQMLAGDDGFCRQDPAELPEHLSRRVGLFEQRMSGPTCDDDGIDEQGFLHQIRIVGLIDQIGYDGVDLARPQPFEKPVVQPADDGDFERVAALDQARGRDGQNASDHAGRRTDRDATLAPVANGADRALGLVHF